MASRHVGLGKHWCEYCRTWIQPDPSVSAVCPVHKALVSLPTHLPCCEPQSIKLHNQGQRHKNAEKDFLLEQRKSKFEERNAANELARTLREIEQTAAVAIARDVGAGAAFGEPPGAARAPRGGAAGAAAGGATSRGGAAPPPSAEEAEAYIDDGLYDVRGVTFLMGEHHTADSRLTPGRAVEVLLPEVPGSEPSWRPASLRGVRNFAVPFTNVVLRNCAVTLLTPPSPGAAVDVDVPRTAVRVPLTGEEAAVVRDAHEALRKGAPASAAQPDAGAAGQAAPPPPPPPPRDIDPDTGLGRWAVVEPAEEEEGEEAEAAAAGGTGRPSKRKREEEFDLAALHYDPSKALDLLTSKRVRDGAGQGWAQASEDAYEQEEGALDALGAYNAAGSSGRLYKGMRLDSEEGAVKEEEEHAVKNEVKMEGGGGRGGPLPAIAPLRPASAAPAASEPIPQFASRKAPAGLKLRKRNTEDN
jgi:hypothetical protein